MEPPVTKNSKEEWKTKTTRDVNYIWCKKKALITCTKRLKHHTFNHVQQQYPPCPIFTSPPQTKYTQCRKGPNISQTRKHRTIIWSQWQLTPWSCVSATSSKLQFLLFPLLRTHFGPALPAGKGTTPWLWWHVTWPASINLFAYFRVFLFHK